jgi:hypothetical protein
MSYFWKLPEGSRDNRHDHGCAGLSSETRSIRLRGTDVGGKGHNVTVRLVETGEKIQAANDLINDRYAWRGYGDNHRLRPDASHLTFTAEVDGAVVGTITLAIDSRHGLAADRAFRGEVDGFRAQPGVKVCELTKFAFSPEVQSKELMATLFHIVFVYGQRSYGCTDLFIEVNPRHVRFYEKMLGFERVGSLKENESVAAPAQLMWLKVATIREQINASAGSADRTNARSLYPFFFSPADESGIYARLVAAEAAPVEHAAEAYRLPGAHTPTLPSRIATPHHDIPHPAQIPAQNLAEAACYP